MGSTVGHFAYSATRKMLGPSLAARIAYAARNKRLLRLDSPRTFNDFVSRRMLRETSESLAWTCDKLAMKEQVRRMGVECRVPETLWAGDDLRKLASVPIEGDWVLKPNSSGGGDVVFGSGPIGPDDAKALQARFADSATGWESNGEWAYSRAWKGFLLERRIGVGVPVDYKIFVFWGVAVFIRVGSDREDELKLTCFDRDWRRMRRLYPSRTEEIVERPLLLADMIACAERIAGDFPFMRVDLYQADGAVWFGETTPYPGAGRSRMNSEFDRWLGELWGSGGEAEVRAKYPQIVRFVDGTSEDQLAASR